MLIEIIPSWRKDKKWAAIFDDHSTVHFGAKNYEDYTIHKDPERKKKYIQRHQKNEDWTNPYKAGTLSRYILWEYPDLKKAISEYNKRFFSDQKY